MDRQNEMVLLLNQIVSDDLSNRQLLYQKMIDQVNELLNKDFSQLVQILYRVDVDEIKLKNILLENPGMDAAVLITDLLIKRQEEKIISRKNVRPDQGAEEIDQW